MKITWFVILLSVSTALAMHAQTDPPGASNALALVRTSPLTRRAIAPRAGVVALWTNQLGQVYWQTNLAKVSREKGELIELVPGGAIARKGPFRVSFAADINTQGAIDLAFDGRRLRSTPVSLAYWDSASGKSMLLAQIKNSVGEVLPDDRIIYRDAFDGSGVRTDILYTCSRPGAFHQDIVIRSSELPDPAQFGLSPSSTWLLAMTEFYETSEPVAVPRLIKAETKGEPALAAPTETLTDQTLVFGLARMVTGKAFTLGKAGTHVPVTKTWQKIGGRTFLIESTPYRLLKAQLDALPRGTAQVHPGSSRAPRLAASLSEILPAKRTARVSPATIQLAQNSVADTPGVVLDYVLLHNQVTYLINVDFGAGSESEKYGWAAMGKSESDFWNYYTRDDGQGGYLYYGELENLVLSMGWSTPVRLTVENAPGALGSGHTDPMFD